MIASQYREEYKRRYPFLPETLAKLSETHPHLFVNSRGHLVLVPDTMLNRMVKLTQWVYLGKVFGVGRRRIKVIQQLSASG